jgi:hypothetical protein
MDDQMDEQDEGCSFPELVLRYIVAALVTIAIIYGICWLGMHTKRIHPEFSNFWVY